MQQHEGARDASQAGEIVGAERPDDLELVEQAGPEEHRRDARQRRTDMRDGPGLVDQEPERRQPIELS